MAFLGIKLQSPYSEAIPHNHWSCGASAEMCANWIRSTGACANGRKAPEWRMANRFGDGDEAGTNEVSLGSATLADCQGAVFKREGVRAMQLVTQIYVSIRWLRAALSSRLKRPMISMQLLEG